MQCQLQTLFVLLAMEARQDLDFQLYSPSEGSLPQLSPSSIL